MAKRSRRISRFELDKSHPRMLEEYVARLFSDAGYEVDLRSGTKDGGVDLIASVKNGVFGQLTLVVQVKAYKQPVPADVVRALIGSMKYLKVSPSKGMVVADGFSKAAFDIAAKDRSVELVTLEELEERLSLGIPKKLRRPGARTVVGKAVLANTPQITVMAAALVALINTRIAALRQTPPNSPEAIASHEEDLERYEKLKRDVQELAAAAESFKKGEAKEQAAVKALKTFAQGVQDWWDKSNAKICDKAYDMGLFGTAVGICSIAGSGGKIAVAVSAALVGGKQLGTVLKGLKGLWQ